MYSTIHLLEIMRFSAFKSPLFYWQFSLWSKSFSYGFFVSCNENLSCQIKCHWPENWRWWRVVAVALVGPSVRYSSRFLFMTNMVLENIVLLASTFIFICWYDPYHCTVQDVSRLPVRYTASLSCINLVGKASLRIRKFGCRRYRCKITNPDLESKFELQTI